MRLDEAACWSRLAKARHGVLATRHPDRGVDAVPVVYALVDDTIVVPVDTVKPKAAGRLQRLRNLDADPRCTLLAEHYDDDWSRLWWVRVHAIGEEASPSDGQLAALADRYDQYRTAGAVASVVVLRPSVVTGWAADDPEGIRRR